MSEVNIRYGDWIDEMETMPDESVQCVVTSPPYWGLRDYEVEGQIGLEETPEKYVENLVDGFRKMKRILKADGTFWLNCGDTYASRPKGNFKGQEKSGLTSTKTQENTTSRESFRRDSEDVVPVFNQHHSLKEKDLIGMPWRVAFALQEDGWWIRNDIIWHKTNPMPESVTDRCTTSHEHIFLLTKSNRYKFNQNAIREPYKESSKKRALYGWSGNGKSSDYSELNGLNEEGQYPEPNPKGRNKRDVWEISTKPYSEAHFATFPPELPKTCIKAGTDEGDTVLDPFCGAGTTGLVANRLKRDFIGVELNKDYCEMASERIYNDAPLLNQ